MNASDISWRHIFFGVGIILLLRTAWLRSDDAYYAGNEVFSYADTLREKIIFSTGGKGVADKYHIRLSYSNSEFILIGNACRIFRKNEKRAQLLRGISPGTVVTVYYETGYHARLNHGLQKIPIVGLFVNGDKLLSPQEVAAADWKELRNWGLAGVGFIVLGVISFAVRKSGNKR